MSAAQPNRELISRHIKDEFREMLVALGSIRIINIYFHRHDLIPDSSYVPDDVHGMKRTLVEQYYVNIDTSVESHANQLLKVFSDTLLDLSIESHSGNMLETDQFWKDRLIMVLKHHGHEMNGTRIAPMEFKDDHTVPPTIPPSLESIKRLANQHDLHNVTDPLTKILENIEKDPRTVISQSRTMIESACHTILDERNYQKPKKTPSLGDLYGWVAEELDTHPKDVLDSDENLKTVLGGILNTIVGLGLFRSTGGDSHGYSKYDPRPEPRHARLAAGAAITMTSFMLETHYERVPLSNKVREETRKKPTTT